MQDLESTVRPHSERLATTRIARSGHHCAATTLGNRSGLYGFGWVSVLASEVMNHGICLGRNGHGGCEQHDAEKRELGHGTPPG